MVSAMLPGGACTCVLIETAVEEVWDSPTSEMKHSFVNRGLDSDPATSVASSVSAEGLLG